MGIGDLAAPRLLTSSVGRRWTRMNRNKLGTEKDGGNHGNTATGS